MKRFKSSPPFSRKQVINAELYAYIDTENPCIAWEIAIGRMMSTDIITRWESTISQRLYSVLKMYSTFNDESILNYEFPLERIRSIHYPDRISRLSGFFLFENRHDAIAAMERWGTIKKNKYVTKVFFTGNLTKVDSEWITNCATSQNDTSWMHDYWKGVTYGELPLYELIGNGFGMIRNKTIRKKSYRKIIQISPAATPILSMACCAFSYTRMKDIATVTPAITNRNGNLDVSIYIDMNHFTQNASEINAAMSYCKARNELPYVHIENGRLHITSPDMSAHSFQLSKKQATALQELWLGN